MKNNEVIDLLDYESEHRTLLYFSYIGKTKHLLDDYVPVRPGSIHKFVTDGKKDSEGNYWAYYLQFNEFDPQASLDVLHENWVSVIGTPPITINPDEWNVEFFTKVREGQS